MISKVSSSGSALRSTPSAPSESLSIPSRRCLAARRRTLLRSELRRLLEWLKAKGVTAIVTGERGEGTLTRYGLEEYVADCVILLDNRIHNQLSTRRLRIVKYRGSAHGTNEYPFIIDDKGITVMPITSSGLAHVASTERLPPAFPISTRCWKAKAISRLQHPGLRHGRQRQVDNSRAFCRCVLRLGSSLHLFCDGKITLSDHPQHGLNRHRPAKVGRQKAAAV